MILKRLLFILILLSSISCKQIEEKPQKEPVDVTESKTAINFTQYIGKDYLIDDLHSYIGFKIKYFGFSPVRGRFDKFDGTIFYNPQMPETFSATTIIDINSINTGNQRRDNDLKKEGGWFDAPNYPIAKFTSSNVTSHENGFYLNGDLTIKGITKPIKINFNKPLDISRDSFKNYQFSLYGTFTISRKEFNISGGGFWTTVMENGLTQLSDEVEMEIELHCRRADYSERYKELEQDSANVRKIVLDKIKNTNIETGLRLIDSLHSEEKISSGALSTVGYILMEWKMMKQALSVFNKKKSLYGNSAILENQLGINYLMLKNQSKATESFKNSKQLDSTNSRSIEYLKLLEKISDE